MTKREYQDCRVAAGLCGNCGCRPLKEGCKWCVHCLREKALTYLDLKAHRRASGLCPECGWKVVPGKWACRVHMKKRREATARYAERRRNANDS